MWLVTYNPQSYKFGCSGHCGGLKTGKSSNLFFFLTREPITMSNSFNWHIKKEQQSKWVYKLGITKFWTNTIASHDLQFLCSNPSEYHYLPNYPNILLSHYLNAQLRDNSGHCHGLVWKSVKKIKSQCQTMIENAFILLKPRPNRNCRLTFLQSRRHSSMPCRYKHLSVGDIPFGLSNSRNARIFLLV